MSQQSEQAATVFIVDDDPAIRFAMQALMDSVNLRHEIYGSGDEFLEQFTEERPGCLVLDIRMPGLGGLELQEELLKRGNSLPVIFITGHGDVPMAVEAMQKGAVDFIQKPFRDQDLLDRIREALKTDRERREEQQQHAEVEERIARLTNREREIRPRRHGQTQQGDRLRTGRQPADGRNPPRTGNGEDAGEITRGSRQDAHASGVTRLALLLEARTIDAVMRVRMGLDPAVLDLGPAFHADPVFAGLHALQRSRNIPEFGTRLVTQGIDNLAVFQFLGAFLGVGMIAATQVVGDALEANSQFFLLFLELLPESIV
jgi:FixJ family two-component response regulator